MIDRNDNRIIMVGEVSAIYPEKARARVIFQDRDNKTSKELPIVYMRAHDIKVYAMPCVGEQVLCTFLGNGLEEGFIVGSYYNDQIEPPRKEAHLKVIEFSTGDYIEYDGHKKLFTIHGDVHITGTVEIDKNTTMHENLRVDRNISAGRDIYSDRNIKAAVGMTAPELAGRNTTLTQDGDKNVIFTPVSSICAGSCVGNCTTTCDSPYEPKDENCDCSGPCNKSCKPEPCTCDNVCKGDCLANCPDVNTEICNVNCPEYCADCCDEFAKRGDTL